MKITFYKEKTLLDNDIKYSYIFNNNNCSVIIDKKYLNENIDRKCIRFYPSISEDKNSPYRIFTENIVLDLIRQISTKELVFNNSFTVEVDEQLPQFKTYKIIKID